MLQWYIITPPFSDAFKKIILAMILLFIFAETGSAGQKAVELPKDHRSWTHVRSTVIHDKNNPLFGFLSVYANPKALEANQNEKSYPEGSVIVGIFHDIVDKGGIMTQGKRLKYVVMSKNAQFAETGGWGFQAFDPTGQKSLIKDTKAGCFQCHTQVESSDYVFSNFVR